MDATKMPEELEEKMREGKPNRGLIVIILIALIVDYLILKLFL